MKIVDYQTFERYRDTFREVPTAEIRSLVTDDEQYLQLLAAGAAWTDVTHVFDRAGTHLTTTPRNTVPIYFYGGGELWFVAGRSGRQLYAAGVGKIPA